MGLHTCCWDHICGLILRWCIYDAYMVIFISIRQSTKLKYTTSLLDDESLIWCCRHMHKDHIIQLWCKIPIVLGAHVDEDCCCWWYQEVLTNDLELKIHSAGYMEDYSKLHGWRHDDDELLPIWCWLMQIFPKWWYLDHAELDVDVMAMVFFTYDIMWMISYVICRILFKRMSWCRHTLLLI